MTASRYDLVTVGGGMGASAIARAMAGRGAKVLILEQEQRFHDRVRGEYICPWGVAEANFFVATAPANSPGRIWVLALAT
jgi:flavin-dependent dehydrogenase